VEAMMNETAEWLARHLFDVPVIQNQYRSAFVEALIAPYLKSSGWSYTGDDWKGWDFEHSNGARMEIKQSAAVQTWHRRDGKRTKGQFDIAARSGYFDELAKWTAEPGRCADVYVFAWNGHGHDDGVDHHDQTQWQFYVVPSAMLPEGQQSISLSKLKKLAAELRISDLAAALDRASRRG
jgi:hypothetical protein